MDRLGVLEADYFDLEYINKDGYTVGLFIIVLFFSSVGWITSNLFVNNTMLIRSTYLSFASNFMRHILISWRMNTPGICFLFKSNVIFIVVSCNVVKILLLFLLLSLFKVISTTFATSDMIRYLFVLCGDKLFIIMLFPGDIHNKWIADSKVLIFKIRGSCFSLSLLQHLGISL